MPQVTIQSVDIVGTWDIIVDGTRIDTLSSSYQRTTITRDHDFVVYVRSDFYDRRDEYIVRVSSSSNRTVYLKQGISLGFSEVSKEKADKENSRGCLGQLFNAFKIPLIILAVLFLCIFFSSIGRYF